MKKIILLFLALFMTFTLTGCAVKSSDLKESLNIIIEKVKTKKPEPNTGEMVTYLIDKAKNDSSFNDENTFKFSLNYIKNNIENINGDNKVMENLIYYGAILQYSPKDKGSYSFTTIGMKTIEAIKEIYVKDSDKNHKEDLDKTKLQVIKALISRVDMS